VRVCGRRYTPVRRVSHADHGETDGAVVEHSIMTVINVSVRFLQCIAYLLMKEKKQFTFYTERPIKVIFEYSTIQYSGPND